MAAVQQREPEKKKERPSALRSIIAGSTAGAVEIGILSHYHEQRSFANLENSYYISCGMYVWFLTLKVLQQNPKEYGSELRETVLG